MGTICIFVSSFTVYYGCSDDVEHILSKAFVRDENLIYLVGSILIDVIMAVKHLAIYITSLVRVEVVGRNFFVLIVISIEGHVSNDYFVIYIPEGGSVDNFGERLISGKLVSDTYVLCVS